MPSICQTAGIVSRAARHRWAAAWTVTLFISGCAPLPTTPEGAATAPPTQAGAPIPEGPNARPSRWGWWSHDRKGAEALAKAAPKPPKLSDKPDPAAQTAPDARDSDQKGLASWYGPGFHGKLTANGERFNSGELTAAHRSLAFGTRVCVRSSVTGKTVVVRINDRGPFAKNRVIDLSQGAAEQLGMVGLGIKPVELWALADDESQCPGEDDDLDGQLEARLSDLSPDARRAVEAHRQAHGESTSTVAKQISKKKK